MESTEIMYKNYGRCVKLSHRELECIVTLDVGPRIISFRRNNKENVLFEDHEREVSEQGEFFDSTYGEGVKWFLYGGHRLWSSPQDWFSYYPDNHPISYEVVKNQILFQQEQQKVTDLQFEMAIEFTKSKKLRLLHRITNRGDEKKRLASWGITALRAGGLEIVPLPQHDTGFLPSRYISVWNIGSKMNDERMYFGDSVFTLVSDPLDRGLIKIGFNVIDGYALYLLPEDVFIKQFSYDDNVSYPDNNINFETFLSHCLTELETMSELRTLQKNEYVEHTEYWSLFDNEHGIPSRDDEAELGRITSYYMDKIT